ncbi:MAG: hypothetical protein ACTSU5_05510 [Promethearchaeota archaeon]
MSLDKWMKKTRKRTKKVSTSKKKATKKKPPRVPSDEGVTEKVTPRVATQPQSGKEVLTKARGGNLDRSRQIVPDTKNTIRKEVKLVTIKETSELPRLATPTRGKSPSPLKLRKFTIKCKNKKCAYIQLVVRTGGKVPVPESTRCKKCGGEVVIREKK